MSKKKEQTESKPVKFVNPILAWCLLGAELVISIAVGWIVLG